MDGGTTSAQRVVQKSATKATYALSLDRRLIFAFLVIVLEDVQHAHGTSTMVSASGAAPSVQVVNQRISWADTVHSTTEDVWYIKIMHCNRFRINLHATLRSRQPTLFLQHGHPQQSRKLTQIVLILEKLFAALNAFHDCHIMSHMLHRCSARERSHVAQAQKKGKHELLGSQLKPHSPLLDAVGRQSMAIGCQSPKGLVSNSILLTKCAQRGVKV